MNLSPDSKGSAPGASAISSVRRESRVRGFIPSPSLVASERAECICQVDIFSLVTHIKCGGFESKSKSIVFRRGFAPRAFESLSVFATLFSGLASPEHVG